MMRYFRVIYTLILLVGCWGCGSEKSFIETDLGRKTVNTVKGGTTYIVVSDMNFPDHEKYLAELQKRWTFTKGLRYITIHNDKFDLPVSPEDSFISLETIKTDAEYGGTMGYKGASIRYYLTFWSLSDHFIKNKQKIYASTIIIDREDYDGRYFLTNYNNTIDQSRFFQSNGYPGLVWNYMERLVNRLSPQPVVYKNQVKTVLKDTLYIPEFSFYKEGTFLNRHSNDAEIKNTLKRFNFPYKILTQDELEKKIMLSETPFYYLVYSEGTGIYNSKTGLFVYGARPASRNLDVKDFDLLLKSLN